jgi:hypothetical protein
MRVGEAFAAKIRHWVGLAPDHIIEDPKAQVLQNRADAKNIVIAANDPQTALGFEDAFGFAQPGTGKFIITGKSIEAVPIVVNTSHLAVVGTMQLSA